MEPILASQDHICLLSTPIFANWPTPESSRPAPFRLVFGQSISRPTSHRNSKPEGLVGQFRFPRPPPRSKLTSFLPFSSSAADELALAGSQVIDARRLDTELKATLAAGVDPNSWPEMKSSALSCLFARSFNAATDSVLVTVPILYLRMARQLAEKLLGSKSAFSFFCRFPSASPRLSSVPGFLPRLTLSVLTYHPSHSPAHARREPLDATALATFLSDLELMRSISNSFCSIIDCLLAGTTVDSCLFPHAKRARIRWNRPRALQGLRNLTTFLWISLVPPLYREILRRQQVGKEEEEAAARKGETISFAARQASDRLAMNFHHVREYVRLAVESKMDNVRSSNPSL